MATIVEIYEEINQEVATDVRLGATSASKVAEFRLLQYVVTSISEILQGIWDIKKRELQAAADAVPSCNASWFEREIRAWQFGDNIILDTNTRKYGYAAIDAAKQIVTQVAITDQQGVGLIKVAKQGPVALDITELNALKSYVKKIQPLGSNIVVISQAADIIKIQGTIYIDPIIETSVIKTNVETAINDYLASLAFQSDRNGTFYTTYLIDAIQKVEGVLDIELTSVSARQTGAAELSHVSRIYTPVAGYFVVDPANPLDATLRYLSDI